MRVLILALLFSVFSYGQDITTIHFNYKWNTTIVIYKGQTPVAKFEAGLSMEILVRLDSIQAVINKYKD